jgi:hypothetical protein
MRLASVAWVFVLVVSCTQEPAGPSVPPKPQIVSTSVATNPHNVLSAIVSLRSHNADSALVRFHLAGIPFTNDSVSAVELIRADSAIIPVLGLLPSRRYIATVAVFGGGAIVVGDSLEFVTDNLPFDLPHYTASGGDPSPGYVVFGAGFYGLVIDNTGRVVWYRRFSEGAGLSFTAQANGRYATRTPTADPNDIEPWLEIDPLGNPTRELRCTGGLQSRPHDLIVNRAGDYWVMCDETRTMDLTSDGGVAGARVTGTDIQHVGADGAPLFQWSPFDHFAITDVDPSQRTGTAVNWTHGNALDFDVDGNLVVSFRNLNEITKINSTTGAVIWRLGGRRNQFDFQNPGAPSFTGQHSVRLSTAGLLILDNLGVQGDSRGERYTIDEPAHTALLSQSYHSTPGVVTQIGGSVQNLDGGRTLVSFGTAGRVEEYDPTGRVIWRIDGNPGYIFRAQRIRSLYAPGVGTSR